jgi:hypothetical protein
LLQVLSEGTERGKRKGKKRIEETKMELSREYMASLRFTLTLLFMFLRVFPLGL